VAVSFGALCMPVQLKGLCLPPLAAKMSANSSPDVQPMKDNDCTAASSYYAHPVPAAPADPGLLTFFTSATEAKRYSVQEVIGKGSYGVVCAAVDNLNQEKVSRVCGC
jgi:serine/threonine protein kinase